jgi:hypothetical protein
VSLIFIIFFFQYKLGEIPDELLHLFTTQEEEGKKFASMGVSLDETMNNMRSGVYTFRA